MSALSLIAIGVLLGGCVSPMVMVGLSEIAWRLEDRRTRRDATAALADARAQIEQYRTESYIACPSTQKIDNVISLWRA
jgi:hypothetical protein